MTPSPGRPPLTPWIVAVLGYLYYLAPIPAAILAGHPLPALVVTRLVGAGALAILALRWRGSHPWGVTLATGWVLALTPSALGAALVAQENLARRHPSRGVVVLTGVLLCLAKLVDLFGVEPSRSAWQVELILAAGGVLVATLVGLLRRSRAEAAESARAAEAARADAVAARVNEARLAERERIAREMHDVVAHRISLVAMHAGALAYRTNLDPDEARATARLIQGNAQASLEELRAMLTTLRHADAPPEPPQPTLAELPVLLADAEDAGQRITLTTSGEVATVPVRVSRQALRIVQESLTNARKHAPGTPVTLAVTVGEGAVLLQCANPLPQAVARDRQGAGLGLVGVSERVAAVGGTVTYGVHGGEYVVAATLPLGEGAP